MHFIPLESILSTNMFKSIKNKEFSGNICLVIAYLSEKRTKLGNFL